MNKKVKTNNKNMKKEIIYKIKFNLESSRSCIRYYYSIYNNKTKSSISERKPGHIIDLREIYNCNNTEIFGEICNGKIKKIDREFFSTLSHSRIDNDLFIGKIIK